MMLPMFTIHLVFLNTERDSTLPTILFCAEYCTKFVDWIQSIIPLSEDDGDVLLPTI